MEAKKNDKSLKKTKNNLKSIIQLAKEKGLVRSYKDAFKDYPVTEEKHQGKMYKAKK